jgi:hypothetical protein
MADFFPAGNWNDGRVNVNYPAALEDIDDVSFTKAVISHAQDMLGTDPNKTLMTGYSNGGRMYFLFYSILTVGAMADLFWAQNSFFGCYSRKRPLSLPVSQSTVSVSQSKKIIKSK